MAKNIFGKSEFSFCCTTSVSMLIVGKVWHFYIKESRSHGPDKGSVTDGRMDGRTDGHALSQDLYMSLTGKDIIMSHIFSL